MDGFTFTLISNSVIYYIIMFVCPLVFVRPCGKGLSNVSHFIYASYSLTTVVAEILLVLRI